MECNIVSCRYTDGSYLAFPIGYPFLSVKDATKEAAEAKAKERYNDYIEGMTNGHKRSD